MIYPRASRSWLPLLATLSLGAAVAGCSSSSDPAGSTVKSTDDPDSGTASNDTDGATCAATVPSSCPTPEPSWTTQIEPIVESHCWTCHANGGVEASTYPLATYQEVYELRTGALDLLSSCAMPPADAPASLDDADRETFLAWLTCGAADN